MIDPDMRKAIYQLHLAGRPVRELSRLFRLGRNTVRAIIRHQGALPPTVRKDKIQIDLELLRRLYQECDGWVQRVHEKLREEEQIQVSYSTLTRLLRESGVSQPPSTRCARVGDEPGREMQHDTTPYQLRLAGQPVRVTASLLYLRYCKRRYLKFYRLFNRFVMKCFLHEALMHWGHSAPWCIIDNTNLARLRGTGSRAVIVPEMAAFAQRYGFQFLCHAVGHSDRKAGVERGFWSVESNFLPGRSFESLEDLNRQAVEWATVRMEHRGVGKSGLIPALAFEQERPHLIELPPQLPAPYCSHRRDTDQYGYVAFEGNYYWVPGGQRHEVVVLQYAQQLKIYHQRNWLVEYPLPADGVKNARISPEGQPPPRHQPKHRKNGSQLEQQRLRALGPEVAAYVDYVLLHSPGLQPHRLLRELWAFSRQVPAAVFVQTLERALRYRVVHLQTLHRIAWFCLSQSQERLPDVEVDDTFRQRPAYQEGCLTDEPDLSRYDSPPAAAEPAERSDPTLPLDPATDEDDDTNSMESEDPHE